MAASERVESSDTNPFDHTATSTGVSVEGPSGASARLTLEISPEQIESSLEAGARVQAGGSNRYASAGFHAAFSLDIVVDVRTAFYFAASIYSESDIPSHEAGYYRLYSGAMDFAVRSSDRKPVSASTSGFLEPGVTYHLQFTADEGAVGQYPFASYGSARVTSNSRLLLSVPEPTSTALLSVAAPFLVRRFRHPLPDAYPSDSQASVRSG